MAAAAATTSERAGSSAAWLWISADLGRLDLGRDLLAGGLGRAELAPGLVEQAAGLRPRREQFLDAVELGLPAGEVGLGPVDAGPDLDELRLGAGDVGLGHLDRGLGLLVPGDRLFDRRLLLLELGLQLGDRQLGEHLALLDRGADVDRPALDVAGDLGVDRRGLERLELARLAHAAADGLPLGVDDLDRATGCGGGWPALPSEGRSQPAASAARIDRGREAIDASRESLRGMAFASCEGSTSRVVARESRRASASPDGSCGCEDLRLAVGRRPGQLARLGFLFVVVRARGVVGIERGRLPARPALDQREDGRAARSGSRWSRRPGRR